MSTLEALRKKRDDLSAQLKAVLDSAKNPENPAEQSFSRVDDALLPTELKGKEGADKTEAVAAWWFEQNEELNGDEGLGARVEALEKTEKAVEEFQAREKQRKRPGFPEAQKKAEQKSLGERMVEAALKSRGIGDAVAVEGVGLRELRAATYKALFQTSAGYPPESVRTGIETEAVIRPIQLLDILPMQNTGQPSILWMLETTRTHGADTVAEGAQKPESEFVWEEQSSPVREIADSVPVTEIQLEDWPSAGAYLEGRLNYGVQLKLDEQCFVGDGTGTNLVGLTQTPGIQTHPKGADPVPDAFYKAMTLIRTNGRAVPTHHIMHPTDWEGIRLMRTADGVYIWGSPSEAGAARLWGLPVVENEARAAGSGFVGSFVSAWVNLWERRNVLIERGTVNDQFRENRLTIRASGRWCLTTHRPAAFCDVTGL